MQSGSPLADSAAISDLFRMQNTSRVYADRVGCMVDKSHRLLECLRSRSYEELGNVRFTVSAPNISNSHTLPDTGFQNIKSSNQEIKRNERKISFN